MLFNSAGFLLLFLPVTLLLYYLLFARSERLRQPFLILATLLFYAIGSGRALPLLLLSLVVNHGAAWMISRSDGSRRRLALAVGIAFDLALLGYFKYADFFIDTANDALGTGFPLLRVLLPLGISFFTFQQIGFLIDLSRGRVRLDRAIDYYAFMLFFPYLLAGPIVRFEEVVPQLRRRLPRGQAAEAMLIGLSIFAIGLFKKVVIADGIGTLAAPVFDAASGGRVPGFVDGWIAAFAYTAQIYFDFSGYSDMAIGVARMFGIVLPLNFHAPLRATSIAELWRRWHVTLSRWVQVYVFQPLAIPCARFAAGRLTNPVPQFLVGFCLPTMSAMVVVGIWHGAGWTFVLFGVLQGVYIAVGEYWRRARRRARKLRPGPPPNYAVPLSRALTLVAFAISQVAFRAPDLATVGRFYRGMTGLGGGWIDAGLAADQWQGGLAGALALTVVVYAVIYLAPTTQQVMARHAPVLEWPRWRLIDPPRLPVEWRPSAPWIVATALLLAVGFVFMMRGTTNFIYFNF